MKWVYLTLVHVAEKVPFVLVVGQNFTGTEKSRMRFLNLEIQIQL